MSIYTWNFKKNELDSRWMVTIDSENHYRLYYDKEAYEFFKNNDEHIVAKKNLPSNIPLIGEFCAYDI